MKDATQRIFAQYLLDALIVASLGVLTGIGRLEATVFVALVGPLLGARVAGLVKAGETGQIPPGAAALLMAGASKLIGRSPV